MNAYRRWGKRSLDLLLLLVVLPFVLPIALGVALIVKFCMGSPVLFRQVRPGYNATPFTLLKFRTMTSTRDELGNPLPDEKRLTRLGSVLRRYSLDELPQLLNVLRGEMSFVGPRPLLTQYLDRYTAEQARRHEVKPGVTGWAQVNGRNLITWQEKFKRDVWYVDHVGLRLDVFILAKTIWKTIEREGISQEGHVTAEEFTRSSQ